MRIVATLPAPPATSSSSSKVMIKSEFCVCHAGEAKIVARFACNQSSPVLIGQSCMSLHLSGTMNENDEVVAVDCRSVASRENGTTLSTHRWVLVRMSSKYTNGSWRGTYVPTDAVSHGSDIPSKYPFQVRPEASMRSARFVAFTGQAPVPVGLQSVVMPNVLPPIRAR